MIMGSVFVGVDGSANSIAALKWAAHYAQSTDGIVHAVYVWSYPTATIVTAQLGSVMAPADLMEAAASEALAGFIAEAELPDDVHVVHVVREGSAHKVLLDQADEADDSRHRRARTWRVRRPAARFGGQRGDQPRAVPRGRDPGEIDPPTAGVSARVLPT